MKKSTRYSLKYESLKRLAPGPVIKMYTHWVAVLQLLLYVRRNYNSQYDAIMHLQHRGLKIITKKFASKRRAKKLEIRIYWVVYYGNLEVLT
jgi:hypothetical protein